MLQRRDDEVAREVQPLLRKGIGGGQRALGGREIGLVADAADHVGGQVLVGEAEEAAVGPGGWGALATVMLAAVGVVMGVLVEAGELDLVGRAFFGSSGGFDEGGERAARGRSDNCFPVEGEGVHGLGFGGVGPGGEGDEACDGQAFVGVFAGAFGKEGLALKAEVVR